MDFKLSKPRNFKNIDGSYAFVNPPITINFESTVLFDVKFNENKPVLFINNTKTIDDQLETIKNNVINEVSKNRFYNFSKETLKDYYVNPVKKVKKGKKLIESVKLKISDPEINSLFKKTKVNLEVSVSSIWLNERSFGIYLNVVKVNTFENKCLLLDSDCESEIDLKI